MGCTAIVALLLYIVWSNTNKHQEEDLRRNGNERTVVIKEPEVVVVPEFKSRFSGDPPADSKIEPLPPAVVDDEPVAALRLADVDWRGVNKLDELRRARSELQAQVEEARARVHELQQRRDDLNRQYQMATRDDVAAPNAENRGK